MLDKKVFTTFDGGCSAIAEYCRPDRYRMIETGLGQRFRIARGGGYSYAAASFSENAVVQEMGSFNRILSFLPSARTIEVEAGMAIGDLLDFTARHGLYLPVQPGYPAITIGGCIAANVHGKNPAGQGTFAKSVLSISLFHPSYGTMRVDRSNNPLLVDMTCGGYGLTGVILSATLQLEPLPGAVLSTRRTSVGSLSEGLDAVREWSSEGAYAYTWHDAAPSHRTFGRGFVFQGTYVPVSHNSGEIVPAYNALTAESRAKLGFSVWGGRMTHILNSAFYFLESAKTNIKEQQLFDSLFPFARKTNYFGVFGYFHLFGKHGLAEYQVLVPEGVAQRYLLEAQHLIVASGVSSVLVSMKLFSGIQRFLRFENDGVCITFDFARTSQLPRLLELLDDLTVSAGCIPNIVKDSRLPVSTVRKCYPQYQDFRDNLHRYDPKRLFVSELSERLHL